MIERNHFEHVPAWALGFLVNGGTENMTIEDAERMNDFLGAFGLEGAVCCPVEGTEHFCSYPEFGLACECVECVFVVNRRTV